MRITAACALMMLAPALWAQTAPVGGSLVSPSRARARIEVAPDHARIGEPIVLTFVVEHAGGAAVVLPESSALPRSLAFVQDLGLRREDDAAAPGRKITRARWSVMALEGGTLQTPPLQVGIEEGAQKSLVDAVLPALEIEPALQPDEDAPRPAKGFRATPAVHAVSVRGLVTGAVLAVLALIAVLVFARARRRRKLVVHAPPSALERLDAIEQRARTEPEHVHALTYALTRLVREAVDAHAGASRAALTDADWSRAVAADERVPADVRRGSARLLAAAERVKYAQESPSPLAVREWLTEARSTLEALNGTRRQAA